MDLSIVLLVVVITAIISFIGGFFVSRKYPKV
jgi:uncharacterized protein YneF (UPF0154 family)